MDLGVRSATKKAARSRWVVGAIQVAIIVALVSVAMHLKSLNAEVDENGTQAATNRAQTEALSAFLANICGVASFEELQAQGLVEECRLAQAGELPDALPDDVFDGVNDPLDIEPDVIPDDADATPADIRPPAEVADGRVRRAVQAYFEQNPVDLSPGYGRAVERAVTSYLVANPPAPGRPPSGEEIASAVRTVLVANPPADGQDGTSVASAALSGCDVVFTFSDGRTQTVGPLCGPQGAQGTPGPPPTQAQIEQAVATYCTANGACRGPTGVVTAVDNCDPVAGQYVTDVAVAYDEANRSIVVSCTTNGLLPEPPSDPAPTEPETSTPTEP